MKELRKRRQGGTEDKARKGGKRNINNKDDRVRKEPYERTEQQTANNH